MIHPISRVRVLGEFCLARNYENIDSACKSKHSTGHLKRSIVANLILQVSRILTILVNQTQLCIGVIQNL